MPCMRISLDEFFSLLPVVLSQIKNLQIFFFANDRYFALVRCEGFLFYRSIYSLTAEYLVPNIGTAV